MDIKKAIDKVTRRGDLTEDQTSAVFEAIMTGIAMPSQIGAFLVALRMKGETVGEIAGAAKVMRAKSLKVSSGPGPVVDTCGTGGTGANTFNISTTSAFVVAGSGVKVAKHGNRSASSLCGSADVLEKLGVKIDVPVKAAERCLREAGIAFLFAPLYHGAMKYAASARKEIGVRTIFNLLGPLCNPAAAKSQVVGVYSPELTEKIAVVLGRLGTKRAFVVHGMDDLDEVTTTARTKVSELECGKVKTYYVTPAELGLKRSSMASIRGGSAAVNARITLDILAGDPGAARDITLANAAFALVSAGKARGFKAGIELAAKAIDSGRAMEKLETLVRITNTYK